MNYTPRKMLLTPALMTCLCAASATSWGAPTVFFDRDDNSGFMSSFPQSQAAFDQFTAALQSFGVATIDDAVGVNPTLAFGDSGITAETQGVAAQAAPGFSIGTQALLELDAVGAPQVDTVFTFNQYVTAFGLFVIQGGDGANDNPMTFRLKDTATDLFVDVPVQVGPGWGQSNVFFVGLADTTPFNRVEIYEAVDFNDGLLMDNVVAGQYVPEPSAATLVTLLGASLCGRGRRRD